VNLLRKRTALSFLLGLWALLENTTIFHEPYDVYEIWCLKTLLMCIIHGKFG